MKGERESKREVLRVSLSGRIVKALVEEDYVLASDLLQAAMLTLYRMLHSSRLSVADVTYTKLMMLTVLAGQIRTAKQVSDQFNSLVLKLAEHLDSAELKGARAEAGLLRTVKSLVEMDVRRTESVTTKNLRALVSGLASPDVTTALNEAGR